VLQSLVAELAPAGVVAIKVEIAGAKIIGCLDLDNLAINGCLVFKGCYFDAPIILDQTSLSELQLLNCYLAAGFSAEGLRVTHNLNLTRTTIRGEINLMAASLGGLRCSGATFQNDDGYAIKADNLKVAASVFFDAHCAEGGGHCSRRDHQRFQAMGGLRLIGARIEGALRCNGAIIDKRRSIYAFNGARMRVGGPVVLKRDSHSGHEFHSIGSVRLADAQIPILLDCEGAIFQKAQTGKTSFSIRGAEIGALAFRALARRPDGTVNFSYARVKRLADDRASWPEQGNLRLNGFIYDEISLVGKTDTEDANARLDWLALQTVLNRQSYRQLADVMRKSGRERSPRIILFELERRRRRESRHEQGLFNRFLGLLYRAIRYGYDPVKGALILALAVVLIGGFVFLFGSDSMTLKSEATQKARTPNVHAAEKTTNPFSPFAYSLDVFLPTHPLHQQDDWLPDGNTRKGIYLRRWLWGETLLGWGLTALLLAGLTGIVRNE
jgi:hypothetical protein